MKPLWDHVTSEPDNETYIYFQGHYVDKIKCCLNHFLSSYLNELQIDDIEHISPQTILYRYIEYNMHCTELLLEYGEYFNINDEIIKLGLEAKMKQLGEFYAQEIKTMATVV